MGCSDHGVWVCTAFPFFSDCFPQRDQSPSLLPSSVVKDINFAKTKRLLIFIQT